MWHQFLQLPRSRKEIKAESGEPEKLAAVCNVGREGNERQKEIKEGRIKDSIG